MADLARGALPAGHRRGRCHRRRQGPRASCSAAARCTTTCSSGAARRRRPDVALVRIEELYPFPTDEYQADPRSLRGRARDRLVPGRAAEPGRLVPDSPSPAGAARWTAQPAICRARGRRRARHRPACQSPARAGSARRRGTDPEDSHDHGSPRSPAARIRRRRDARRLAQESRRHRCARREPGRPRDRQGRARGARAGGGRDQVARQGGWRRR